MSFYVNWTASIYPSYTYVYSTCTWSTQCPQQFHLYERYSTYYHHNIVRRNDDCLQQRTPQKNTDRIHLHTKGTQRSAPKDDDNKTYSKVWNIPMITLQLINPTSSILLRFAFFHNLLILYLKWKYLVFPHTYSNNHLLGWWNVTMKNIIFLIWCNRNKLIPTLSITEYCKTLRIE